MRKEERQHLKENPLAKIVGNVQSRLTDSGRLVLVLISIVVLSLVGTAGFYTWTGMKEQSAGELLAEAMATLVAPVVSPEDEGAGAEVEIEIEGEETASPEQEAGAVAPPAEFVQPPGSYPSLEAKLEDALGQLLLAADEFPTTPQGLTARYQAAAVLVALERADDAVPHYRQVMAAVGDELYGQMSLMGLAEALLLTGQASEAILLFESQIGSLESLVPIDAVLMRLGHAHQLVGQSDDALAAFNRVLEEFPVSIYYADALEEVETLRQFAAGAS